MGKRRLPNRENGESRTTLGERIGDLRAAAGETQAEASAATGLTESEWCNFENDKQKRPSADKIIAISQHFGVSVEYLYDLKEISDCEKDSETAVVYSKLSRRALQALRAESHDPEMGTKPICQIIESDSFHRLNCLVYKAVMARRAASKTGHITRFLPGLPKDTREQVAKAIDSSGQVLLSLQETADYYEDLAASVLKEIILDIAKSKG